MIVFVLIRWEYSDQSFLGVFSSEEKAKAHVTKAMQAALQPDGECFDVNAYELDGDFIEAWELRRNSRKWRKTQ